MQDVTTDTAFAETRSHDASKRGEESDPVLPKQFDLAKGTVDEKAERDQQHESAPPQPNAGRMPVFGRK